jgi:hypothetical protein
MAVCQKEWWKTCHPYRSLELKIAFATLPCQWSFCEKYWNSACPQRYSEVWSLMFQNDDLFGAGDLGRVMQTSRKHALTVLSSHAWKQAITLKLVFNNCRIL